MKIAIIGAGINGLYLAWKLSEKGEKVTIFEKRNKIGKEACSGLFSKRILEFIPQSRELAENKIGSVLIHFPKRTLKVKFANDFFVMNHFKLDNLTAGLARKAGANIVLNQKEIKKPDVLSSFERIIGSDGANSIVRQWLDLPKQKFLLGIQGLIDRKDDSDYVETWPTKSGFIWKIPRGREQEWGIMEKPNKAKLVFDRFLEKNNLSLKNEKSALIPRNFCSVQHSKIALCGDAVGLTKPWSGGGVVWGLAAADILLKNFPDFLKYQKELKKFFLPRIIFSKIATKAVYCFGFHIPWLIPKNVKIESDFLL